MATKIIGNQISTATEATLTALALTSTLKLPNLNQTAVNALTPDIGTVVFNTTEESAQIYAPNVNSGSPGWTSIGGGGPSVGENSVIRTNQPTIDTTVVVGPTANGGAEFTQGLSTGPMTVTTNGDLTIESGSRYIIL